MKKYKDKWYSGSGSSTSPLYDFFVQMHNEPYNIGAWHGTSMFLPAHKWYLWVYESGLIYTAYHNYRAVGLKHREDACRITLPYWDWTLDNDDELNDTYCPFRDESPILDANDFGSSDVDPTNFYVRDGLFKNLKDWTLAYAVTDSAYSSFPPDKRLKRVFDCTKFPLTTGPTQTMDAITSRIQFRDFSIWLEATPHSFPHLLIGMSMAGMNSPDDPIFWLHHCNIDRLYHLWMDCHDYENIPADIITSAQYEGFNPSSKVNPITGLIYDVTTDAEIPYSWRYPSDNVLFPKPWPTPRELWPSVDGYHGYNVRYGPDNLVLSFGEACPHNEQWTLVNYEDTQQRSISKSDRHKEKIKHKEDTFKKEIASGKKSRVDVIHDLAYEECTEAPKLKISSRLLEWIEMNDLDITAFDTVCDKISKRFREGNRDDELNSLNEQTTTTTQQIGDVPSPKSINDLSPKVVIPLWLVISLSVVAFVLLVTIIVLVVIFIRQRKVRYVDDSYRVYNDKVVYDVKKI
jgi:tyrosinase